MFMLLSYNIAYCNNIVAIQCSVSMYTDTWHSILRSVYLQSSRDAHITQYAKHLYVLLAFAIWLAYVNTNWVRQQSKAAATFCCYIQEYVQEYM